MIRIIRCSILIKKTPLTQIIFTEDLHYLHGQSAFAQDRYEESIYDFNKVLQINPYNKNVYLDRSCTYLAMGKYEEAVNDYNTYIAQNPRFDVTDFSIGFIKGFPKGAIESGHQLFTFASECITHPIATGKSICEAISTLVQMSASQEWKTIAETLVPDVTELIKEWNMLTPQEQGEKAGYVFAKIGGDFFLPGAACKIMANGVKGAKEIAVITRNLKKAEKTLVLDALNQSASAPMKFAEATSQLEKIEKKFPKIKIQEILNQIEEQINNSSLKITGFTEHGLERMLSRGINPTSVIDALKNPIQINAIKWDYLGRPSQRFIGEKVEVVINPQTKKILSVNSTSSKKLNKILKKAKMINIILNKNEFNFLTSSKFIPLKLRHKIADSSRPLEGKHLLHMTEKEIDSLRDYCGEQLQLTGFDENYELTKEGELLENLIDKFFLE